MARGFTKEQIDQAANTDLFKFLTENFSDDFKREGHEIHMKDKHGLTIKEGAPWFHDFASGKSGNGINLLRNYYDYSFHDAVYALLGFGVTADHSSRPIKQKPFRLPPRDPYGDEAVISYLHNERGIPKDTIQMLLDYELIYQERNGHLVFVNHKKTMFQVRRTYKLSSDEGKIKSSGHTKSNDFWYLWVGGKEADTIYICEGAVDAISLYELLGRKPGIYASMSGVSNQSVIDRIVDNERFYPILCVDNDHSGELCRIENQWIKTMIPQDPYVDWNEMLQAGAKLPMAEYGS